MVNSLNSIFRTSENCNFTKCWWCHSVFKKRFFVRFATWSIMRNFWRDLNNINLFLKNTTASWGCRADHRPSVGSAQINKIKVKTREILTSLIPISGKTKQDTRLPPVYFAPSYIANDVFKKDESVFFQHTLFLHHVFWLFQPWVFFWFLPKNHENEGARHFHRKIPFETHSRKNLPHFEKFQGFFQKSSSIFPKKTQVSNVLRILRIPIALYSKFSTIWWKNFHVQLGEQTADVGVNAIGKYPVKNVRNSASETKILLPYSKYGAK